MLVSVSFGESVASDSDSDTKILLTSRFILWDTNEKMIDPEFKIHIVYQNETYNNTGYYKITINQDTYNGTVNNFTTVHILLNNTEVINQLSVSINNHTVYTVNYIVVISGVSKSNVRRSVSEWLISLNPLEWRSKEWNIFFAVIVASFITVPLALRYAKVYRKRKGVVEVK
jgi:hypothetical protein